MDSGALWATGHGVAKQSDMTEQLNNNNHMVAFTSPFSLFFSLAFLLASIPNWESGVLAY